MNWPLPMACVPLSLRLNSTVLRWPAASYELSVMLVNTRPPAASTMNELKLYCPGAMSLVSRFQVSKKGSSAAVSCGVTSRPAEDPRPKPLMR